MKAAVLKTAERKFRGFESHPLRRSHRIELGGLVAGAGVVDLTGDDRATISGAPLWMADKLNGEDGERARELWAGKGNEAFAAERNGANPPAMQEPPDQA